MKHRILLSFVFVVCSSSIENVVAQEPLPGLFRGNMSHSGYDTTAFKTHTPLGADLFLSLDVFGLHFNSNSTGGFGIGMGGEVRVKPVFMGGIITGLSDNEGILSADGTTDYRFISLYGGTWIGKYRIEIGGIHGWGQGNGSGSTHYTSLFVGVNRRFGGIFLFEPEIKILLPIDGTFITQSYKFGPPATIVTEHSHLRDLFFGLSIKIGLGYN